MAASRRKADAKKKKKFNRMKIAKNDTVIVTAGDYRYVGKTGKVLKVFPESRRVIVEKVRFVKKHTRAMLQQGQQGGILEKEGTIHVSKVMLVCPKCGKPTRLGATTLTDGTKERVCRKCNEMVPRIL
jgi:large subunit ribosomal protein L24